MLGPQTYLKPPSAAPTACQRPPPAPRPRPTASPCAWPKPDRRGLPRGGTSFQALRNNKGMDAYQQSTNTDFSVTVRTADGRGSGYAIADVTDAAKLNTRALTQRAADSEPPAAQRQGH
ncbi:MAG: hypothetical protein WKG07_16060 [Hymenobacter sp.]